MDQVDEKEISLLERCKSNPWVLVAAILAVFVILLVLMNPNISGRITGNIISGQSAGENLLAFYESNGIEGLTIDSVEKVSGLYQINFEYQGKIVPIYVTLDGKLSGSMAPIVITTQTPETTQQPAAEYTAEDIENLRTFSSCLADNGIKIYGANWCGWTKKLAIDTLGGFDVAGDAYVECTENDELCKSEGVSGYPTIKINGEAYTGARTLESLGQATGCAVPQLSVQGVSSGEEASCN